MPVITGDMTSSLPSAESPFPPEKILGIGTGSPGRILGIGTDSSDVSSGWENLTPICQQTNDERVINQEIVDDDVLADQKYLESPGAAVMETHRLTDLTWEKLAEILDASRRSPYSWTSGENLNEKFGQQASEARVINQDASNDEALAYQKHLESPRSSIMEVRRLTGLTWEKLADVFGVSRRSLHSWASGRKLKEKNEERVYSVRDTIREIDRGTARENRTLLLSKRDGVAPIGLLRKGDYKAFVKLVGAGPGRRRPKLKPLSRKEREARRPPPLEVQLSALQDSVHIERGGVVSATPLPSKPKK